jgi:hypothetical protein
MNGQTARFAGRVLAAVVIGVTSARECLQNCRGGTNPGAPARLSTATPTGYPRRIQYPFMDASTSFASCLSFARLCC